MVDGLTPDDARQLASDYAVGVETLKEPRVKEDKVLFRNITGAALRALAYNAEKTTLSQAVIGATRRGARLLTWAWLNRSATFWAPVALLLVATIAFLGGAPALLTGANNMDRVWAAAAVPGALFIVAGGPAGGVAAHRGEDASDRVMAAAARTEAIRLRLEPRLPLGFQRVDHLRLAHTVDDHRYPERTLLPVALGYVHPLDRLGLPRHRAALHRAGQRGLPGSGHHHMSMPAVLRPALSSVTRRTLNSALARDRSISFCRLRTLARSPSRDAV